MYMSILCLRIKVDVYAIDSLTGQSWKSLEDLSASHGRLIPTQSC